MRPTKTRPERRPMMVPTKSELLDAMERAVDMLVEPDADKEPAVALLRTLLRLAGR